MNSEATHYKFVQVSFTSEQKLITKCPPQCCGHIFPSVIALEHHRSLEHNRGTYAPFVCPMENCRKFCQTNLGLKRHLKTHLKKRIAEVIQNQEPFTQRNIFNSQTSVEEELTASSSPVVLPETLQQDFNSDKIPTNFFD